MRLTDRLADRRPGVRPTEDKKTVIVSAIAAKLRRKSEVEQIPVLVSEWRRYRLPCRKRIKAADFP